jgi:hypothetical protein
MEEPKINPLTDASLTDISDYLTKSDGTLER